MDQAAVGQTGQPWTGFEIEATVRAYFEMLDLEVRGVRYTKVDIVRDLQRLMPARSTVAIERKFQNISAVLDEVGEASIEGYKPLPHYQRELRRVVLARLDRDERVAEALESFGAAAVPAAQPSPLATTDVLVAPPHSGQRRSVNRTSVGLTGSPASALRDFRQHELGVAGERWVLDLEREYLRRSGRRDLASLVRWVAREDGDGLGYDIQSFRETGQERLIEVKTTNMGPLTPFYITRWEVEVSRRESQSYSLYRVHGFNRDPRIYVLDGNVEERARLEPKVFLGIPI